MDEDVLAAVVGLDEAIALLRVEPLHSARSHVNRPQNVEDEYNLKQCRMQHTIQFVVSRRQKLSFASAAYFDLSAAGSLIPYSPELPRCGTTGTPQEETMKLRFAIVGLAALFGLAAAGSASAMPLAPLSTASNVENVAVVCGPNGCIRRAPVYRGYGYGYRWLRLSWRCYGVRRYGHVHRGYGYHRGYRR